MVGVVVIIFFILLVLYAIGAGYVLALVYWAGLVVLRPLLDLISKRTQPAKGFIPETPTVTSNIAKHADDSSLLYSFIQQRASTHQSSALSLSQRLSD